MDHDESYYRLWLSLIPGIGPVTQHRLLNRFHLASVMFETGFKAPEAAELLPANSRSSIQELAYSPELKEKMEKVLRACERKGIGVLLPEDMGLAPGAVEDQDFPTILYVRGRWRSDMPMAGIVGARRCSRWGKETAASLASECVQEGKGIVSGMAKGIDSYSQTAALFAGGYTAAVLGCGLDICYPSENLPLMRRISECGALISEYPPGTEPARWSFPRRNRIIAGLSDELHIIEAGRNSGTRTTRKGGWNYFR